MTALVVDASVAAKWFLDEAHSPAARAVLEAGRDLAAPELLAAEVGNVLLKAVRRGELAQVKAERSLDLLRALPVVMHPVSPLTTDALALAQKCRLAYYDALYTTLAVRIGARLITADESLVRALRGHGLDALVESVVPAPGP